MRKKYMWWILIGVVALGGALAGPIMSDVERPKYKIVEKVSNIEIRDYAPVIIAEVNVTGERDKAIKEGFRILADYIFGNNVSSEKVSMTAPVIQQASESVAMTAPVLQQGTGNTWKVSFVMPANYMLDTLPIPNDPRVLLKEMPARRFIAIEFSGLAGDKSVERQKNELAEFIAGRKLVSVNSLVYAFYNPPWTLPFFRRNEVMQEIAT
jgi:hypothetical protein